MNTLEQKYENYTEEDLQVWQVLYDRQMKLLPEVATREFLLGLDRVNFHREGIPNFAETNPLLEKATGWNLTVVPGIVNDDLFFELLADCKFPATTWLRKMKELDYLEEPDMFHDVFAHVPLLSNQPFVDFLQSLSRIALKHLDNAYAIDLLSRVYWYSVEFGLIREAGKIKIYGAGILSSSGETVYSLSDQPEHHAWDVRQVLQAGYRKDKFQTQYFIIDSYEQLYASIPEIEAVLQEMLEAVAVG